MYLIFAQNLGQVAFWCEDTVSAILGLRSLKNESTPGKALFVDLEFLYVVLLKHGRPKRQMRLLRSLAPIWKKFDFFLL